MPDNIKLTTKEQGIFDKECAVMRAEFNKKAAAAKRLGKPFPDSGWAGSWAHTEEFRTRIRKPAIPRRGYVEF
jgi:hypothetical protein